VLATNCRRVHPCWPPTAGGSIRANHQLQEQEQAMLSFLSTSILHFIDINADERVVPLACAATYVGRICETDVERWVHLTSYPMAISSNTSEL
jgi:hypothetical protein